MSGAATAAVVSGLTLRPHQVAAVHATLAALDDGHRALGVAPTGIGKTVIAVSVIREQGGRSLTLVHRDELVEQTLDKMRMIGLGDLGVVKAERDETGARHVVASIQTLAHERRRHRLGADFDLVWVDEAHHSAAPTYLAVLDQLGCFDEEGPGLFGTTATPDRLDTLGLEHIFDRIAFNIPLLAMIRQGYLADIRALRVVLPVDLDQVHTRGGDLVDSELAAAYERVDGPRLIADAYAEHARERKAALFVPGVALAHATAAALCALGITAEAVDGAMPLEHRRAILRRLHDGCTRVVPNCQVLTEGWDEPSVDCIALARPTRSRALYQQMIGRGLRLYPGKTDCLVLDLVGASDRHELVSVASLLGLDPRAVAQHGVIAADEEREQAAARRQRDGLLRGQAHAAEIDLLGRREIAWASVDDVHLLSLGIDNGWVAIEPTSSDRWRVLRLGRDWGSAAHIVADDLDFGFALGHAEDLARRLLPQVLRSRDAAWRQEPPSPKQADQYARRGWVLPATRGEAIDYANRQYARWAWMKARRP
jgi:superfamily II DNA or RNA helicase